MDTFLLFLSRDVLPFYCLIRVAWCFFTFARPDLVWKKLFAFGSVSKDHYVSVIVPFCCFSKVGMNESVAEEVDNSRIWIYLLHLCYVVVFYSNSFFTEVSFWLQHFHDPVSHVTSISLLNLCCRVVLTCLRGQIWF
jgi:hypothetical protein